MISCRSGLRSDKFNSQKCGAAFWEVELQQDRHSVVKHRYLGIPAHCSLKVTSQVDRLVAKLSSVRDLSIGVGM